jgi:hypothetical protein
MSKEKRITLNADKRKTIADVFQSHWEREDSPVIKKYYEAKETYNQIREQMKSVVETIVRKYQPEEDVEIIRAMNKKYGSSGGDLYHDNCFRFRYNYQEVDNEGNLQDEYKNADVNFGLDDVRDFGYAYYRDDIKAKGYDADFKYRWSEERRNPRYYEQEENIDRFLGYRNSSNEDKGQAIKPNAEWENDFKLWVIGTSYCHSRQFAINETEYKILNSYNVARDNLIMAHEKIFEYTNEKMKKLRLGLKSYRYFDQAKALADKLGVVLNESMMNESSSLALSVYSPENLASLLEDKVEMTRDEKIAMFKAQQQSVN